VKVIVEETLQQVLEAEMDEALQASKSERTANRLGYRAGYYNRTLVTRVGHIELRVPQDRQGRFRTEVFERYQRSEKALGSSNAGDVRTRRVHTQGEDDHRRALRS
jgi:transposase-like protein